MRPRLYIGCRGTDHDHWAGKVYPESLPAGRRLEFLSERLGTVLVQSTWRGPPAVEDVAAWVDSTPESFRFSFVAPEHSFEGAGALDEFLDRVRPLGERLGVVAHVVPAAMRIHVRQIDDFLAALPRDVAHAVEFNSGDWFVDRTRETLERHDAALSIQDRPDCVAPWWVTAGHVLVRRHGALGKGAGKYTSDEVHALARRILEEVHPEKTVYVYFENDQEGFAAEHAVLLRDLFAGG